jgi:hypothetical protein
MPDGRPEGPPKVIRTTSREVNFDITPDGRQVVFWEPERIGDSLTYRAHVSPIDSFAPHPIGPSMSVSTMWWVGYDSRHILVHHQHAGGLRWTTIDLSTGEAAPWRQLPRPDGSMASVAGGQLWVSSDGRSLSFFDSLGRETVVAEWPAIKSRAHVVLAVAPDGRTVGIQGFPESGPVQSGANIPVELFELAIPELRLVRVARASSMPYTLSWGLRWLRGGVADMAGLEGPQGTRFWVPDGKGGLKVGAEMPPGFDWTSNSADGRVMMSSVTRWTSDILTARLDQPR